jgi:transposase
VEETLVPGASVARVARKHDVNANQVFYWRKLFREGRLGISMNPQLLPVKVEAEPPTEAVKSVVPTLSPGTIEIALPGVEIVRISSDGVRSIEREIQLCKDASGCP